MTTAAQPRTQRRKPKRGRIKKIGDGTLLVAAILISAMALTVCWFGVRTAETGILRYEAKMAARSWTVFLLDNLPNVAGIMAGQGVTEEDRSVIGSAIGAGGVLQFQILSGDGRVVYASRQGDIGTTTADPQFRTTVQKGHIHAAIRGIGTFALEPQVVSEAFVPIIGGGRFLGAIKVHEDVTARADQLSRIGYLSFLGLLGFILLIALVMTALVAKNFEGSVRAKRALATSRKRLENYQGQLVRVKESAEAAGQLRSGVLADVIGEMRTPIGGVVEVANLLNQSELTDRQRRWVGTITQSAETMLNAVENVLDFRLIETDEIEIGRIEFDLPDTIAEVVETLAGAAAAKKLELAYYMANDAPEHVWGDPKRLHQILFTLMDNAIQRTDRGDVVLRATTDRDTSDRPVVRFEVRDTSAGISPEDQARLFAPEQPAPPDGGAELGLSICHRLIREMGGKLVVESAPGEGSCFRFSLQFDLAGHGVTRPPQDIERLAGKRILVVDDNAAIREILLQHFADWSVDAHAAGGGESAIKNLRHAAEQGQPFDVVVVDMTMPGMSGLDLATAIRAEPMFETVRLVMMTPVDAPTEDIEASGAEISARVEKPVHARTLLDEVASVIVDAPGLNRASPADDGSPSPAQGQRAATAGDNMAEKYLRHTLISLEKLREAVASEKAGAVQMTADSLKSSSTDIGATALAGLCRELESMARVGNLGGVQSMLDAIEEEYGNVCETLRAELSIEPSDAADPQTPSP